jgi:hypothetical protein
MLQILVIRPPPRGFMMPRDAYDADKSRVWFNVDKAVPRLIRNLVDRLTDKYTGNVNENSKTSKNIDSLANKILNPLFV